MQANLLHLVVNMFGLWSVGRIFEYLAGFKNFILLYLIAGISGNICSFALIPMLSVGASGSLFGILFCLYVIQKYEEKIASQLKCNKTNMQLGKIILFNVVLNVGFGLFNNSIFDWAAHLGGSVAGILFGFALTTRHKWNLKIILSEKTSLQLKKKFLDNYQIYYFAIIIINILFLMSYFKVKKYQQFYGLAIEKAAQNQTLFLKNSELNQYKSILVDQNKETNPNTILNNALILHKNNFYLPAYKLYEVLLEMNSNNFGSKEFTSNKTKELIQNSMALAKENKPLKEDIIINNDENLNFISIEHEQMCSKPAQLFMTLGYFEISGKLFECAFTLNINENNYAIQSLESFYLASNYNGINEMLNIVNSTQKK
ncbi:rhomboid family intramembrane serine protease [Silvanigrella paludirubra]|uniref:Rhomboid family intramembrane serine protease n=2 Tax=Silvanigrella paludirubra TaxID=2499159 RepID=A0A6N6VQE5_9BACT|nr:rhomboid family intramembrane serine protease [Silvanigrella paludirubra]